MEMYTVKKNVTFTLKYSQEFTVGKMQVIR